MFLSLLVRRGPNAESMVKKNAETASTEAEPQGSKVKVDLKMGKIP